MPNLTFYNFICSNFYFQHSSLLSVVLFAVLSMRSFSILPLNILFTDIDECATGTHNCHGNATCSNSIGGFSCQCKAGFTGDGVNSCLGMLYFFKIFMQKFYKFVLTCMRHTFVTNRYLVVCPCCYSNTFSKVSRC